MTNTEKIRTEIVRRREVSALNILSGKLEVVQKHLCLKEVYENLLSFIDSLPKETVTDCHQLEEEIDRAIDDLEGVAEKDADGMLIAHLTLIEHLKDFARHFFELGRLNARKEE